MVQSNSLIHLFTHEYPYGKAESFIEEEVRRLQKYGVVVVVPAFCKSIEKRTLPDGAKLETSLSQYSWFQIFKSPCIIKSVISELPMEVFDRGLLIFQLKSQVALWSYVFRVARFMCWILGTPSGRQVQKAMSFWSNSEAVGLAVAKKKRTCLRFVSRSHRFDIWEQYNPYSYLPFRSVLASQASFLLPCSSAGAEHIKKKVNGSTRVLVAPLGIDRPVEPNLNHCRQSVEEVVVLTCSSGAAVKRLGLITHSIIVAAKKDPDISWRWIHLGEGIEQIKPILEMCPKNLNVELPGPVSRLEVFHYHRDHKPNVFVNLSSSEGVPITVMEAMSMGTPVVATAAGGTGDIVDAEVGVLLPVEIDSASVATSIRHVVETSESKRVAAIDRWQKSASSEVAQAVLDFVIPKLFTD